jgi:hypothetical protein
MIFNVFNSLIENDKTSYFIKLNVVVSETDLLSYTKIDLYCRIRISLKYNADTYFKEHSCADIYFKEHFMRH